MTPRFLRLGSLSPCKYPTLAYITLWCNSRPRNHNFYQNCPTHPDSFMVTGDMWPLAHGFVKGRAVFADDALPEKMLVTL